MFLNNSTYINKNIFIAISSWNHYEQIFVLNGFRLGLISLSFSQYEIQLEGEFVLYRHKSLPIEVNVMLLALLTVYYTPM